MDQEDTMYIARLAEQAERYDDMVDAMKKVARQGGQMSEDGRNLFSVAYKNVIGARRSAWRIISSIESKARDKGDESDKSPREYRCEIEKELRDKIKDVLDIVDEHLLPMSDGDESKVFYYKMKGDYLRYLAEFTTDDDRDKAAENALIAYKAASDAAESLSSTHPIRLGLALNFSVFYYEILNSGSRACELAKSAFDSAIGELDSLKEDSYKDSTLIMQLLRDNLTLWTSENDGEDEKGDE